MRKKIMSWTMSFCLGLVLFSSTLYVFPVISIIGIIVGASEALMQIAICLVVFILFSLTAFLTVMWKKSFGFRPYHAVMPFIIITSACAQDMCSFNTAAITAIVQRNVWDHFSGSLGKLKIGLCFSVPLTAVILLTFGMPSLVRHIREKIVTGH